MGSYGLTWALKNQSKISKLVILNTPLTISSPLPGLFQQLRFCLHPVLLHLLSIKGTFLYVLLHSHGLLLYLFPECGSSLPLLMNRVPFLGEFTCQNAVMAERFIEAGSAYVSRIFHSIFRNALNFELALFSHVLRFYILT